MPAESQNGASTTQGSTTMYKITSSSPASPAPSSNATGDYSDQELLNLVNYYEVSRVELKNVWNECLSIFSENDLFI
jgi:hypothetical protein